MGALRWFGGPGVVRARVMVDWDDAAGVGGRGDDEGLEFQWRADDLHAVGVP